MVIGRRSQERGDAIIDGFIIDGLSFAQRSFIEPEEKGFIAGSGLSIVSAVPVANGGNTGKIVGGRATHLARAVRDHASLIGGAVTAHKFPKDSRICSALICERTWRFTCCLCTSRQRKYNQKWCGNSHQSASCNGNQMSSIDIPQVERGHFTVGAIIRTYQGSWV